MTDILQRTTERVQDSMDDILSNFKAGAKITVLVRTPGKPTADFCMTSDDLDEVIAMVQRRKGIPPVQHVAGSEAVAIQALKKIEDAALGGYLTPDLCAEIVASALASSETVGGDDWFSQVVSFFVSHEMLDARDEYDISDIMAALADNYTPVPKTTDPIDAIKAAMEERGLKNSDLYEIFGGKSRTSEILRRKRALQVGHIRQLHNLLGIPYAKLSEAYELDRAALASSEGRNDG